MIQVDVKIVAKGDPVPWPELTQVELPAENCGQLTRVSILEDGMSSGRASVGLLGVLSSGGYVLLETSAAMLESLGGAARGAQARFDADKGKAGGVMSANHEEEREEEREESEERANKRLLLAAVAMHGLLPVLALRDQHRLRGVGDLAVYQLVGQESVRYADALLAELDKAP